MFKTLIVDKYQPYSDILRGALQTQFPILTLEQAASIREAHGKIYSMHPDLIVSDWRLSDGNGLQLTRSIRAAGIESEIIILTSHDLPEYRDAALSSGANYFMTKGSVRIAEIFSVIGSILSCHFSLRPSTESVLM